MQVTTLFGGQGDTKYEKSKLGLNLSEAKLIKKEQDVFMKAIEAYTGLILAYEKLKINEVKVANKTLIIFFIFTNSSEIKTLSFFDFKNFHRSIDSESRISSMSDLNAIPKIPIFFFIIPFLYRSRIFL